MSLGTILVIILAVVLLGVIPSCGCRNSLGYYPSGVVGILLALGRI